jgi:hypothetical protein
VFKVITIDFLHRTRLSLECAGVASGSCGSGKLVREWLLEFGLSLFNAVAVPVCPVRNTAHISTTNILWD